MTDIDLEHLDIETQGVKLHVVAAGPADGPVVVLLHGFPESWRGWHRQIEPLARAGYRVIVPDQRGYNRSDKPPKVADYRLDRLAKDVVGILDHLGVRQVCVAGHDFGATVTWWLLAFHPDRIRAAAILNVPHPRVMQRKLMTSFRQALRSWYMFFFQLPALPERVLALCGWRLGVWLMVGSSRPGTFSEEELQACKRAWSMPGAMRAMIQWYRAAFRYALPKRTPTDWVARAPVLILWGDEDRFLSREMAEESLRFCQAGTCIHFPGVSHWIQHEAPARVAEELIGHFSAAKSECH